MIEWLRGHNTPLHYRMNRWYKRHQPNSHSIAHKRTVVELLIAEELLNCDVIGRLIMFGRRNRGVR